MHCWRALKCVTIDFYVELKLLELYSYFRGVVCFGLVCQDWKRKKCVMFCRHTLVKSQWKPVLTSSPIHFEEPHVKNVSSFVKTFERFIFNWSLILQIFSIFHFISISLFSFSLNQHMLRKCGRTCIMWLQKQNIFLFFFLRFQWLTSH